MTTVLILLGILYLMGVVAYPIIAGYMGKDPMGGPPDSFCLAMGAFAWPLVIVMFIMEYCFNSFVKFGQNLKQKKGKFKIVDFLL